MSLFTQKNNRERKAPRRAAMVIASLLMLTLLAPSAALAGTIEVGSGDSPAPSKPKPKPQPSNPGNDGSGSGGFIAPKGITTKYTSKIWDYEAFGDAFVSGFVKQIGRSLCPAPAVGITLNYSYKYDNDARAIVSGSMKTEKYSCAQNEVSEWSERCTISSTAQVSQVTPTSRRIAGATETSAWGSGDRSLEACRTSSTFVHLSATPDVYGKYEGTASTLVQTVTVRKTTNPLSGASKTEIVGVGMPFTSNSALSRGQLTCDGWVSNWSTPNGFTHSDCGPDQTDTPTYQCTPQGDPTTIGGEVRTDATIFRNGEDLPIVWQTRVPTGNFVSDGTGSTRVARSGSPWNTTSLNQPPGRNDAMLYRNSVSLFTSNTHTQFLPGTLADFNFRAVWASNSGDPTVLTPQWNQSGTSTINGVEFTGFDSASGAFQTSPITKTVSSIATCYGEPVSINVVRATTAPQVG